MTPRKYGTEFRALSEWRRGEQDATAAWQARPPKARQYVAAYRNGYAYGQRKRAHASPMARGAV